MSKRKKWRKKINKYADLNDPEATFDYHEEGILTEDEIKEKAEEFIIESKRKGHMRVLIITGKGLHSENGPVIKPLLSWYLTKLNQVKSVKEAKIDRGGSGALEIELK